MSDNGWISSPENLSEAELAVIEEVNDIFGFAGDAEHEPTEADIATLKAANYATNLVEEYVARQPQKVRKKWGSDGSIVLPSKVIDGKLFQLSATHDTDTGATTVNFMRPDKVNSGFTLFKRGEQAALIIDPDRAQLLSDEAKRLLAANDAHQWIKQYRKVLGIPAKKISDKSSETLPERMPQMRRQRRRSILGAAAIGTAVVTLSGGLGAGVLTFLSKRTQARIEFSETHHLPTDVPAIGIGETKPVVLDGTVDQAIINDAEVHQGELGFFGDELKYAIDIEGNKVIHASMVMEFGWASDKDDFDCVNIALKNVAAEAAAKVVAIKQEAANNLIARLDRTQLSICNVGPTNKDLNERDLFIEITNEPRP